MSDRERALQYLSADIPLHIDMLEAIRRGKADLAGVADHGVILYHRAAEAWMISAAGSAAAESLLSLVPPADLFVCHQDDLIPLIQCRFGLDDVMRCRQAVWPGGGLMSGPAVEGLAIRVLDEDYLPFVNQYYSHDIGSEYLRARLQAGDLYGAFVHDQPAGFAGFHPEGSLGMLEVLPDFRRRGIGLALQAFLANLCVRRGEVPFAQIKTGNSASLALQHKAGFTLAAGTVSWLMKREDHE